MRVEDAFFWVVQASFILGGTAIIIAAMWRRLKIVEMEHRERMAMIERGMMPGLTAADPLARSMHYGPHAAFHDRSTQTARRRMLSGGIAVTGFGLALMVLIGIAAESSEAALGVGGAIMVIGLSFVVIALVQGERPQQPLSGPPPYNAAPPFTVPPASPSPFAPRPPDKES
jgi:hypothetical protein